MLCYVLHLVANINFNINIITLSVASVNSVGDLGVYLDTAMSMGTHISKLVSSCFIFNFNSPVMVAAIQYIKRIT